MSAAADIVHPASHGSGSRLASFAIRLGALSMFVLIMAYFAVSAPGFLSTFNIVNVIEQSAILGVLAFGMAVVIIGGGSDVQTGGIDLSIAANAGLCAAVYALTTDLLGVPSEKVAFLDDSPANVVAARQHGWQALHHVDTEASLAWLDALLDRAPVAGSRGTADTLSADHPRA